MLARLGVMDGGGAEGGRLQKTVGLRLEAEVWGKGAVRVHAVAG